MTWKDKFTLCFVSNAEKEFDIRSEVIKFIVQCLKYSSCKQTTLSFRECLYSISEYKNSKSDGSSPSEALNRHRCLRECM